jgi:hypothetical protein
MVVRSGMALSSEVVQTDASKQSRKAHLPSPHYSDCTITVYSECGTSFPVDTDDDHCPLLDKRA